MKKTIPIFLTLLVAFWFVLYVSIAFVTWQPNPYYWEPFCRFVMVLLGMLFCPFMAAVTTTTFLDNT